MTGTTRGGHDIPSHARAAWRYALSSALPICETVCWGCERIHRTVLSYGRKNQLSLVEPVEDVAVESVQRVQARTSRPDARRRPRLSNDEEREIARLYAETSTPTSQIRERFGIGDGSLYRAMQRQGVALRGRTATGTRSKPPRAPAPVTRRRRSSGVNQAVSQPRSTAATTIARAPGRADGRSGGRPVGRASFTENTTSSS